MNILLIILAEFFFISLLILLLFKLRGKLGLAPLYILLGSVQYLQANISNTVSFKLFNTYSIYPSSVILFSAILFATLLVYIKEGVVSTRALIFGIIISNAALSLLFGITYIQEGIAGEIAGVSINANSIFKINYRIFIIGTTILLLDFFLLPIVYQFLITRIKRLPLFAVIFFSLASILIFDGIAFTTVVYVNSPGYTDALVSHIIGKTVSAFLFSLMLYGFIGFVDKRKSPASFVAGQDVDVFSIVNFRKHYGSATERKLASQLEITLSNISDAFVSLDKDWNYTYVNNKAAELFSRKPGELIGKHIWTEFPEGVGQPFYKAYYHAMETQETQYLLEYYQPYDKWFENKIYPSKEGLAIYFADVTAIKKAEEQIIKSEKYLENIINNIGDPLFVKDKQSKLLLVNNAFCRIFSLSRADIIGKTLAENVPPDQRENFLRIDKQVLDTGIENINEEKLTVGDGETQIISTKKTRFIDEEGIKFLIGTIRDITDRKKSEEQIVKTSEELRLLMQHLQNVREEERKRIGRELHDDLGQQLTAIKMYVAWIDKRIPVEQEQIKEKLSGIIELLDGSNLSMRKILNELRVGILDNDGLIDGLKWLCQQFEDSTAVDLDFSTKLNELKVNEQTAVCVFRVLQESLNNIAKHAAAKNVKVIVGVTSGKINMSIEDDGKGFEMDNLPAINSFGILGMKERVSAVEGKFSIESAPGSGTKTVITVPYI